MNLVKFVDLEDSQAEYKKKLDKVMPEELQERIHKVERQLHDTLSAYMP